MIGRQVDTPTTGVRRFRKECRLYAVLQSSTRNPGTRANSVALFVTRVAPRLTAVPAISRSRGPIVEPCLSSSTRMCAAATAAAVSKGTC